MKYFLSISYKGTAYKGWQKQPGFLSVQENLESAIAKIFKKKINCIGCGRTDSGVHANNFYCHFVWNEEINFDLVFRLNKILPIDISVNGFFAVPPATHAQHSAVSRTYTYFIHHKKSPFIEEISSFYSANNLSFERLHQTVHLIATQTEFKAFCKTPNVYKSTTCKMLDAKIWQSEDENQIVFQFSANRFLRGMVRILVANILEVGYGKIDHSDLMECFETGISPKFFKEAYPQGLHLTNVEYPFSIDCKLPLYVGTLSDSAPDL